MFDCEIEGRSLDTPDGTVYCMNVRDLREVMQKYISDEFAEYVSLLINESEADIAYEKARAETDADAIAEENDYLRSQLLEAREIIDSLAKEIEVKQRLNKQDFYLKLVALSRTIDSVL